MGTPADDLDDDLLLDGMLCPISQLIMRDPVCTVDGHSYERSAIEAWFRNQEVAGLRHSSPMTGETLPTSTLIPNITLKRVIDDFLDKTPEVAQQLGTAASAPPLYMHNALSSAVSGHRTSVGYPDLARQSNSLYDMRSLSFAEEPRGKLIELEDHKKTARKCGISVLNDWLESIVFCSFPLSINGYNRSVEYEIKKTVTGWGGIHIGVTPDDPKILVKSSNLNTHLEEHSWWVDSDGWLHVPDEGASLCGWTSGDLKAGDLVAITCPEDGTLCVYVNGRRKVQGREARIPSGKRSKPLYGFIALTGNVTEVALVEGSLARDYH
ncbi:hypothetical protein Pmar_PMAR011602 [Perkinsus marinus ATCC 50983]|uniref:U-box domain-containing protein n=1 Tax=Perkinsus marinus (strain ATCC 50983 / TXsc) TaxID=423536 RepID=C5LC88_PERM5|nr:hypothetical protein Pmar_PMAR011602 [Perkinsus marinus ATCC 50983]EER05571.1 hypothetical protein Pmar_PMAR011602 [Perkinsus marinus ATCC 50983]|eukprot:XP_002773755.1 hypothetical protein Pmar_PMAR011602 [Perkinsus marinus ATCC 50983]